MRTMWQRVLKDESGKVEWWSWPFDLNPDKDEQKPQFVKQPEYPEAEKARSTLSDKLQAWGNDPYYGAVSPDWGNIWDTVQRQVRGYYEGTALSPGVKDRLKSSLARKNISENPASDYLMMAADAEQGNQLKDIATSQGIEKARLGESGRQFWTNATSDLSKQKPSGTWWQQPQQNPGVTELMNLITGVGAAVATGGMSLAAGNQQNDWLSKMLNTQKTPQTVTSPYSQSPSWLDTGRWS